jgi:hypothetical protein
LPGKQLPQSPMAQWAVVHQELLIQEFHLQQLEEWWWLLS